MIHALQYSTSQRYRDLQEPLGNEQKPVIAQICFSEDTPNDAIIDAVITLDSKGVAAVDINLGCPQINAKKHKYGGYLPTAAAVRKIRKLIESVEGIHITAKIRVDSDINTTVNKILDLYSTGISALTIHSRERHQIQGDTGTANWDYLSEIINAVREHVPEWFPLISNGGIQNRSHVQSCLKVTGATAVMAAEGMLWDPTLECCPSPRIYSSVCRNTVCSCGLSPCVFSIGQSLKVSRRYLFHAAAYPPTMYQLCSHLDKLLFQCRAQWPILTYQIRSAMPPVTDPLIKGAVPGSEVQLGRMVEMWESLMKMYEICVARFENRPDPRIGLESCFGHEILDPGRYAELVGVNFRDVGERDVILAPIEAIPQADSFVASTLQAKFAKLTNIDTSHSQSPELANPCEYRAYRPLVPEACVEYAKCVLRYASEDTEEDGDLPDLF
eukprot:TRINITY_DN15919_c0_g1_i1.p1 TRINITY_DN15919_c0_g1~~TRINITY_DN15919_c0_g1_i1.p1  ORF type:complete len:504 (+),score=45.63 TRINITY_DN15919_c0_g1_i1:187-1512(+)